MPAGELVMRPGPRGSPSFVLCCQGCEPYVTGQQLNLLQLDPPPGRSSGRTSRWCSSHQSWVCSWMFDEGAGTSCIDVCLVNESMAGKQGGSEVWPCRYYYHFYVSLCHNGLHLYGTDNKTSSSTAHIKVIALNILRKLSHCLKILYMYSSYDFNLNMTSSGFNEML